MKPRKRIGFLAGVFLLFFAITSLWIVWIMVMGLVRFVLTKPWLVVIVLLAAVWLYRRSTKNSVTEQH